MLLKFLWLAMGNISTAIYFSAGLLASDYFQTGLVWGCEDQLAAIRDTSHTIIRDRYKQNQQLAIVKKKNMDAEIKSVCKLSDSYVSYFDYATLCESKDNVDFIDTTLQKVYYDFLNGI